MKKKRVKLTHEVLKVLYIASWRKLTMVFLVFLDNSWFYAAQRSWCTCSRISLFTGALELEGVEVQVQLDDKKDIKDLIPKKVKRILFFHSILYLGSEKLSWTESTSIFKPTFLQKKCIFVTIAFNSRKPIFDRHPNDHSCGRGLSIKTIQNSTKISF